jgi:predicted TIM-barrel fold metal-dependent hydrolase
LRIDSHVLYCKRHPPEHLASILARNRFDGAILFGDEPVDLPHILGVVVPVERLETHRMHPKLCGVSMQLSAAADFSTLGGLPVDVAMSPDQFPLLDRLAAQHPARRFVIDHLARPAYTAGIDDAWRRGMESAAGHPNVYCKISGVPIGAAARPFVQHALAVFGPSRLMFGSEWPAYLPDSTWKEALAAFTQAIGAQSMDVREQLLGLTVERFFNLCPEGM